MLAVVSGSAQAAPGETLAQIRSRGTLRCGVSDGITGFSIRDAKGRWSGLDVDFCRAVAAAALGDAGKVTFVPLKASERFPALKGNRIDLLARNTTWTFGREAALKLLFAGVLFYDGQAFMVPVKGAPKTLAGLKGATVCVEKSTTSVTNLHYYSVEHNLEIKPLFFDSVAEVSDAFFSGKCRAITSDSSQLAAVRLAAPGGSHAYAILPERISKEPLGPVVRQGDEDWFTLVRWVLFTLIDAEGYGITRENVTTRVREPQMQHVLGASVDFGKPIGIDANWAIRVVQSVGNYGEIFERNIGRDSPLRIERGLNRLWSHGGLMYSPPMR